MLKIVEVHPAANPQGDYVVLQNVGLVTVSLRGWAVCTDEYLEGNAQVAARNMYIFAEDIPVKPYTRVVLFTGCGEDGWVPTIDGKQAYCAFWKRPQPVWKQAQNVHILQLTASRKVVPIGRETVSADAPPVRREALFQEDSSAIQTNVAPLFAAVTR